MSDWLQSELLQEQGLYLANSFAASCLAVLYYFFYKIHKPRNRDKATFFHLVAWGWLFNFVYLVAMDVSKGSEYLSTTQGTLLEYWTCAAAALMFLLASRLRFKDEYPRVFSVYTIVGVVAITAVGPLAADPDDYPIIMWMSVVLDALGPLAIAAVFFSFFKTAHHVYGRTTSYSLVVSMVLYSLLQFTYPFARTVFVAQLDITGEEVSLLLGMIFKSIHIFGLAGFAQFFFADYARTRSAFQQAELCTGLFERFAHEIRTPVQELKLRLDDTIEAVEGTFNPERFGDLEAMRDLIGRITNQVDGYEQHRMVPGAPDQPRVATSANTACDEALRSLVRTYSPNLKTHRRYKSGTSILVRREELYHVLVNIFKNAMEATRCIEEKGLAVIEVRTEKLDNRFRNITFVRITVRDNGPGFAEAILPVAFLRGKTTKGGMGRGNGLWIAKHLVERNKGSITIRNYVVSGTRGAEVELVFPHVVGL